MILKLKAIGRQRNGICGLGFYILRFSYKEKRNEKPRDMIGWVHDCCEGDDPAYGVTDIGLCLENKLDLLDGNGWRGDHFVDWMREEIRKHNIEWDKKLAK